jgi:hypothetical protein
MDGPAPNATVPTARLKQDFLGAWLERPTSPPAATGCLDPRTAFLTRADSSVQTLDNAGSSRPWLRY